MKTKDLQNPLLVTVIAKITAKRKNSEIARYFLPLMSCLINKLIFHMLFTSGDFMFSDFKWKKSFCNRKWSKWLHVFVFISNQGAKELALKIV